MEWNSWPLHAKIYITTHLAPVFTNFNANVIKKYDRMYTGDCVLRDGVRIDNFTCGDSGIKLLRSQQFYTLIDIKSRNI